MKEQTEASEGVNNNTGEPGCVSTRTLTERCEQKRETQRRCQLCETPQLREGRSCARVS
jgi:hypothetical protein